MLKGEAVSGGIGIGTAVQLIHQEIRVERVPAGDGEEEIRRFEEAVGRFCLRIQLESALVERNLGQQEAGIILAHSAIAQDPELLAEVSRLIREEQVCAEYAFAQVCDGYVALFETLEDEIMRARAADFRDIRQQVLALLLNLDQDSLEFIPPGTVLIAEDITPSQASTMPPGAVAGIVTRQGTRFSHLAIIARALGIPTVVGVEGCREIGDGETVAVDGESGQVFPAPPPEKLEALRQRQRELLLAGERLRALQGQPTWTKDGKRIRLYANLALEQELESINRSGADGIGLVRTEFLYMDSPHIPTREEQLRFYRRLVQGMQGKPVIIRTLDAGGDKAVPSLGIQREENPYLGNRGIRLCLERPEIFRPQLAALLLAAAEGPLRIMLPMVTGIHEVLEVRALLDEIADELRSQGTPPAGQVELGVMIETPAAALCAEALAWECDFFSIGTNDLIQYTIAVDRNNPKVSSLYSPLHPAVLQLIALTVEGAQEAGIPVGICGEAASDPLALPLLLGLGVEELSVAPGALLQVRQRIAGLDMNLWSGLAQEALALDSPIAVQLLVERVLGKG